MLGIAAIESGNRVRARGPIAVLAAVTASVALLAACNGTPAPSSPPSAATPAPAPVTPSPSPAPRPEPTTAPDASTGPGTAPEPEPHRYEIHDAGAETTRETGLYHEVEFRAQALNRGGGGEFPVVVGTRLNDGEFKALRVIEQEEADEPIELARTHRLGIGQHRLEFIVGDVVESFGFNVGAADLALEMLPLRIEAPNVAYLPLRVTNHGDLPAVRVRISGQWGPKPWHWQWQPQFDAHIPVLHPGATQIVDARINIPPGEYEFEAVAGSATLESNAANNEASRNYLMANDLLSLEVGQAPTTVYEGDQTLGRFTYSVRNAGTGESPPVWAGLLTRATVEKTDDFPTAISGLPRCQLALHEGCWWGAEEFRIGPGESRRISFSLPLDIGVHELIAFVGGPGYGVRPGAQFFREVRAEIVPQPATQLNATLGATVRGYWSDGTASVDLTGLARNTGAEALLADLPARLVCEMGTDAAPVCDHRFTVRLANGFGPEPVESAARIPVNDPMTVNLQIQGQTYATLVVSVPPKILGVKRFIWNCFSARPGYAGRNPTVRVGCSGWEADRIQKWWQDTPVRVWATGSESYRAILDSVLSDLAPLLNFSFEYVDSEQQAQLRAFVGVPNTYSTRVFGSAYCEPFAGCGGPSVDGATGIASSGVLSAWSLPNHTPEGIRRVIAHEVIHAMAAVGHRTTPDHLMAWPLSPTDEALLALHSHPLVEPGMTMAQVRGLVVLEDELLDGVAPGPVEHVWRAAEASSAPGSASFQLSGDWSGAACRFDSFGPIEYRLSDIGYATSKLAYVRTDQHQYWYRDHRYWTWEDGRWQPLSDYGVQAESGWLHELTDLLPLLRWSALRGAEAGFGFVDLGNGLINLAADTVPGPEHSRPVSDLRITVDPASHRILAYQMTRAVGDGCQLRVTAENGQYGQALVPPSVPA